MRPRIDASLERTLRRSGGSLDIHPPPCCRPRLSALPADQVRDPDPQGPAPAGRYGPNWEACDRVRSARSRGWRGCESAHVRAEPRSRRRQARPAQGQVQRRRQSRAVRQRPIGHARNGDALHGGGHDRYTQARRHQAQCRGQTRGLLRHLWAEPHRAAGSQDRVVQTRARMPAVQDERLGSQRRGETEFWMLVRTRLGGILSKVARALEVFAAAERVVGALELRRMPAIDDLAILGIQDETPLRRYIGR